MLSRIIIVVLLLISVSTFAQKTPQDIVVLKTGERLYGNIIERTEGVSVKIEITRKSVRVEAWKDIDTILKQSAGAINWQRQLRIHNQLRYVRAKGFACEFSMLGITRIDDRIHYSINASFGYQFNPYFAFMAGAGTEVNADKQYVPIFGQFRINFIPRTYTPFFFSNIGYAYRVKPGSGIQKGRGGAYLNTGIGFRYMPRKHFGFNIKAGFRLQQEGEGREYYDTYNGTIAVKIPTRLYTGFNVSTALEF